MTPSSYLGLAAGLLVLTLTSALLLRQAGAGLGWRPVVALGRAAGQLAVVAVLIGAVLAVSSLVAVFVAVMLVTASWISGRRISGIARPAATAAAGVAGGPARRSR